MKKTMFAVTLLLSLCLSFGSCSVSPETQAIKDAKAMNRALEKNDADAMMKADKTMERHLKKYSNDSDKFFRYADTYKDNLTK